MEIQTSVDTQAPALIAERKTNAARRFVERLLRLDSEGIAKIILFGSVAEGRARADSDVDLLILGLGDLTRLSEAVIDAAFETSLETGESVEPVVLPAWRRFQPGGLFVPHALRRGKELFTMPESDLEHAERQGLKSLAESYLQAAEQVFQNGYHRQAADLAYNAAELIAKALLIGKADHLPTTHSGIVNLFGQHLVQSGLVPRELGREINAGLFIRNRARYEHTLQVGEAEAERVLRLAKRLLDELNP